MYRKKHGLTRESLVLPGLLLLRNIIETDRGCLGNRRACLFMKKITNHESSTKKQKKREN